MSTIKNEHPQPSLEIFHLSDKSKADLVLTAQAFEMAVDEIVEKAIKALGYQEFHVHKHGTGVTSISK